MPNWCTNALVIEGDVDTLKALVPVLEKGRDLLEAIAPRGERTGIEAWGTKWDVETEGLEFVDNGDGTAVIEGWFDSAWSPPIDAFHQLAQDWDSCYIELKYYEHGMGFVGVWDSEGGDAHYDDLESLLGTTEQQDPVLFDLLEHFAVEEAYDFDEEMSEEVDI